MGIDNIKNKIASLEKLEFITKVALTFSDDKKETKLVKKLISLECRKFAETNSLVDGDDEALCFNTMIEDLVSKLTKVKSNDQRVQVVSEMNDLHSNINEAIIKANTEFDKQKVKSVVEGAVEKAKSIGGALTKGVGFVKDAIGVVGEIIPKI